MTASARDRARRLELVIRAAMAEERLLGARLARLAESQRRTRDEIERELRQEHLGHNGAPPPPGG